MSEALIQLRGVTRVYQRGELAVPVLTGLDLDIGRGEFVALLGASGSGKSTLLNLLGCLDRPTSGRYTLGGQDVAALDADGLARLRRRYFGFVFQQYHLLGGLNAVENVELPAIYAGTTRVERRARASLLLESLGLADRLGHRPGQLSGGQQQRVSIARALMNDAPVILADEPTGALDHRTGLEVLALLAALHAQGRTVIIVTHDAQVAAFAQRRIEIADGAIVADEINPPVVSPAGTPTTVQAPPALTRAGGDGEASVADTVRSAIGMALRTLHGNLLRTLLTLLGVVIGVAAVVTVVAFGAGAKAEVIAQISAMGTDLLNVRPGAPNVRRGGNIIATLLPEDAQALAGLPNVAMAVPEMNGALTVRQGAVDYQTSVTATTPEFAAARDWAMADGVFFDARDMTRYAAVAVIGATVARNLYGTADPLGQVLLANNVPLEVIGVLASKGAAPFGGDMDDVVVVPMSTGSLRLLGQRFLQGITVRVQDNGSINDTQVAIETLLRARHRVEDFQVRNMAALLDTVTAAQNTLTVLLGTVGAISLLVGGIGVMNIMLVSVTERTREIGLRMATGARQQDIQLQFAVEAVVVCALGGLLGVGGGVLATLIAGLLGVPVLLSGLAGVAAAAAALLTGLVFGQFPARRAARLDPVAALSSE